MQEQSMNWKLVSRRRRPSTWTSRSRTTNLDLHIMDWASYVILIIRWVSRMVAPSRRKESSVYFSIWKSAPFHSLLTASLWVWPLKIEYWPRDRYGPPCLFFILAVVPSYLDWNHRLTSRSTPALARKFSLFAIAFRRHQYPNEYEKQHYGIYQIINNLLFGSGLPETQKFRMFEFMWAAVFFNSLYLLLDFEL